MKEIDGLQEIFDNEPTKRKIDGRIYLIILTYLALGILVIMIGVLFINQKEHPRIT